MKTNKENGAMTNGTWDAEGIWNAVFGCETRKTVLAECETQGVTPQGYVSACVTDAIDQGADFDENEAFKSLCHQLGVEPG
jgi:phage terminase large subunit-like protein